MTTAAPGGPPSRHQTRLTPLGATLHETIQALVSWTEEAQNEVAAARTRYDARRRADRSEPVPAYPSPG